MSLPAEFADLAPWLSWSLPTMAQRSARRSSSSMEELQAFYSALLPRLGEALEYLSKVPANDNGAESRCLLNLTKSLAEVAPAVELFHEPTISYGYDVSRFSADPE